MSLRVGLGMTFMRPNLPGIGVYAENLLKNLLQHHSDLSFHVFTTNQGRNVLEQHVDLRELPSDSSVTFHEASFDPRRKFAYLRNLQSWVPRNVRRHDLDVFHSLDYPIPYRGMGQCRVVATVHDLNYRTDHGTFTPRQRALRALLVPRTLRQADAIVCISQAMRVEIARAFHTPDEKLHVVHNGFQPLPETGPVAPPSIQRYVAMVGTLKPHKDHETVIRALAEADDLDELHLVIMGRDDGRAELLRGVADRCGIGHRVHMEGFATPAEVAALYQHAEAYVSASRYEGFGMTVLEAMAAGVPVACSDIAAHREVAQDAAATFRTGCATACAGAIREVIDPRNRDARIKAGVSRAARFSWKQTAQGTAEVYARVAGRSP